MEAPISNDLFSDFLLCAHKAYLKLIGRRGKKSDFETLQLERQDDYRNRADKHLRSSFAEADISVKPPSVSDAIRHGYSLITNADITRGATTVHFDALLGKGTSPQTEYSPVLFAHSEKPPKFANVLLGFCGLALEQLNGTPPRIGTIIHGIDFAVAKVKLATLVATVTDTLQAILDLKASAKPPQLRLNDHCPICEFREGCHAAAVEHDDLSLLRGLKKKELDKLNGKGIFTVTQLSYTFRPRRKRKQNRSNQSPKHYHSLQALAVRTNTIYVTSKPQLPSTETRLYFDIEGVPDESSYYLVGLLACNAGVVHYQPFWADDQSNESAIWNEFLSTIQSYRDYTLFHFGSYDSKWLAEMGRRHGGDSSLLSVLRTATFNTLTVLYSHVYFPTYSNDLKSIASCLGFRWSDPSASGLQSLVWRHEWNTTRSAAAKAKLLRYNQDDCLALKVVTDALQQLSNRNDCNTGDAATPVIQTDELEREHPFRFGRNPFFSPDMEWMNRCAYFDYQREKVYIRTSKGVKKSEEQRKRQQRPRYRVNSEVVCQAPTSCPFCGGLRLIRHGPVERLVYDLKLMKAGAKRWIVKYRAHRYLCKDCGKARVSNTFELQAPSHFGATLGAWCVYQTIALRQSQGAILDNLDAVFGYKLRFDIAAHFKTVAAKRYRSTYESLRERIRTGTLVHVDETKVSIKGQVAYIWAFTNMEEVVYVFRWTRDGDVLDDVLRGFSGVLISDFYTAYDSVPCNHQKCLIHLMRDINDDVFKNPFDEEVKQIAQWFTATLRPIVETIDRYGLKKWHLNKHKAQAEKFVENVDQFAFSSEVAKGYQKRIRKNKNMLFTFLDYDGVPWNNNNAEHAIKRFAFLRRVIGGSASEAGIEEYMVLLSLYETLRLRGVSFLKFLVSGVTEIDEFVARR